MNHFYKPMLAKEVADPFSNRDWIFEIKWDGFRALAYINKKIRLMSRNNKDFTDNFPELQELGQLAQNVVLDGEIVVIKNGKASFQAIQERGKAVKARDIQNERITSPAEFIVFDILEKDGKSLLSLPLIE